ncbi:Inositol hexakisphosphate kinase 3 [Gracilariopsis chorda]|uniref:Kinase n=1 Tax=Gracilariopsis chorda TaxID=448386 RepID=A0A2V3J2X7_9FLOR|nr:Inositol hexakisphosphate kinase 3 [Gracilariopsis chorda]|eukprot:PXF48801.1 Inositol hexakisphosphate kinase 3 [Gracilariopsis chorda]
MDAQSQPHKRPVTPYPHQVGGHGQLTVTSSGRILKPLLHKELAFYNYINSDDLHPDMRWITHFTPKFYGEAQPNANPSSPTAKAARPRSPSSPRSSCPSNSPPPNPKRPPSEDLCWLTHDGVLHTALSPWAAQMSSRIAIPSSSTARSHTSIKLEDINRSFCIPCVIDCKIGTRHYDDDASEEKRRRHIEKANATTSAKCGIRLTGMQSFKRSAAPMSPTGLFESRDKYHGRTLREHDLLPQLTWFFHDNFRVRVDAVAQVLERIRRLRAHLIHQRHFFFYSSSLLIVYEGALPQHVPSKVDVRMIDFAHTVRSNGRRDDGYLKGIDYLISVLNRILQNERNDCSVLPASPSSSSVPSSSTSSSSPSSSPSSCASPLSSSSPSATALVATRSKTRHEQQQEQQQSVNDDGRTRHLTADQPCVHGVGM